MQNITVIGIGRLGLGFALMLEKSGYNVVGVDINHQLKLQRYQLMDL